MDILRTIKIYHICIGQKIRFLGYLSSTEQQDYPSSWSYLCAGEAHKAQREDFPTRSVRAQFPQADRQTDVKQVLWLTTQTLPCLFYKCWTWYSLMQGASPQSCDYTPSFSQVLGVGSAMAVLRERLPLFRSSVVISFARLVTLSFKEEK